MVTKKAKEDAVERMKIIEQEKALSERYKMPIWYGFLAKDKEGVYVDGVIADRSKVEEKLEACDPPLELVWISEDRGTAAAAINSLRIVKNMSDENKKALEGFSTDPEVYLKTLKSLISGIKKD